MQFSCFGVSLGVLFFCIWQFCSIQIDISISHNSTLNFFLVVSWIISPNVCHARVCFYHVQSSHLLYLIQLHSLQTPGIWFFIYFSGAAFTPKSKVLYLYNREKGIGTPVESQKQEDCKCCRLGLIRSVQWNVQTTPSTGWGKIQHLNIVILTSNVVIKKSSMRHTCKNISNLQLKEWKQSRRHHWYLPHTPSTGFSRIQHLNLYMYKPLFVTNVMNLEDGYDVQFNEKTSLDPIYWIIQPRIFCIRLRRW